MLQPRRAPIEPRSAGPAAASQRRLCDAFQALAQPGRVVETRSGLASAAYELLLALLDYGTPLWLSPSARFAAGTLRLRTGCSLVEQPASADYAWVGAAHELPALEAFIRTSEERPCRAATLFIEVPQLAMRGGWRLQGPAIGRHARLAVQGLPERFLAEWAKNRSRFPHGSDVFLASGRRFCGLPHTTDIVAT
jgi:alpha-D-ribose 1-methylphosphonate 5-triphosphate synthase subunit PhnH